MVITVTIIAMMILESYPGEILINVDALCTKLPSRELPLHCCGQSGHSKEFLIILEPFDRVHLKYICARS